MFNRSTSFESRNTIAAAYIVTGALIDSGNGVKVGTMCFCMNRTVGTSDTALPHSLGRTPNGYKMIRSPAGGVLYDASTGTTAWGPGTISLRATAAGVYSFELV